MMILINNLFVNIMTDSHKGLSNKLIDASTKKEGKHTSQPYDS